MAISQDTPEQIASNPSNLMFVEQVYADYLSDPASVAPEWRLYFEQAARTVGESPVEPASSVTAQGNGNGAGNGHGNGNGGGNGHAQATSATARPRRFRLGPSFRPASMFNPPGITVREGDTTTDGASLALLQERVDLLIRNYRVRGHKVARLDPLDQPRPQPEDLDPATLGLTEADLDRPFSTNVIAGPPVQTLRQIISRLRNTYCRSIGAQFMYIDDPVVRRWLSERMESTENRTQLTRAEQLRILRRLTVATKFEQFLQTNFIGAKTFSLEGGETLIPLLDLAIEKASEQGVEQVVLGMAHRGRLNVLANIMGKPLTQIFHEFEDADPHRLIGGGDVKYHLGHSSDWTCVNGKNVHLSLCFNPSHLEFIGCVAEGRVRAKQDRVGDAFREKGLAIVIHGDSAIAGEGIVQETLNLSQLEAYHIGGTLHVVVNNQLGFTTLPQQYRSTIYATDIAKMLQIPVFHVNGEDPEAVAQVVRLAMDFRRQFKRDVVIDMYCYRRRGHNEGDEPAFTQPLMYQRIERRESVRQSYLSRLLEMGDVTRDEAEQIAEDHKRVLEDALIRVRQGERVTPQSPGNGVWSGYMGGPEGVVPESQTGVKRDRLADLLKKMTTTPADFHPHPKMERLLAARRSMAEGQMPLDWATAESLAFASLAVEGARVRMTGQDCERGTFSQRHAVLHDVMNGHTFEPLTHLAPDQARVEIRNSPLSEAAVLGFEYGYSLDTPEALVIWEAQFGDFANAAQVIIDQFITSAEDKWQRLNGLVMLLPHGFEGQGPEHSSARLERFLMLAGEDNIQVAYPTTPAQMFHLLRRQVVRKYRKPLIVMTPKSLLRLKECSSSLDELAVGTFQRVMDDAAVTDKTGVSRILLCSGKVFYDLTRFRESEHLEDVAIVRLEQLYPFPEQQLAQVLAHYPADAKLMWVQEEPRNMGAWPFLASRYAQKFLEAGRPLRAVTRPESASPATGSGSAHKLEQSTLIKEAFSGLKAAVASGR
jgi:2-oxoglutarate dehydrogenase E1 component